MSINITSRHVAITDAIKAHVYAKLAGVLQEYPQVEHAHVVLDTQKFRHIVEVTIQAKNHVRLEAQDVSDDMYKSIDQVVDKVDRQLRKSREKRTNHKGSRRRIKLADFEQTLAQVP
ncbi:MAG: ribosome-associated translation inhibitor RaiA [Verrucomicrobia bacterium]|nr:ribosome-associated translation inhibitor RaiA [Verrucomicrobiota bacterium]MBU4289647.1 ribosome-associated translation inhibitor RaiA [Verrucomicrobiota bacterium]MBU4430099.1 ribosome-associated translation inhibitor RaiA [Verrucomicrobiota bacterium]MCG2681345.1 ribosome-associated translation inhibitor RaiA [Kiritimatiellia bacterium]